jgi:hypothetical protein
MGAIFTLILSLAAVFAPVSFFVAAASPSASPSAAGPVFILAIGFLAVLCALDEIRDAIRQSPEKSAAAIVAAPQAARKGNSG